MASYWIGVATLTGIYLIATLGVSILVGFTGLFSLGHAGFMAIGAYVTAIVVKSLQVPFLIGLLAGIFAAMLVGALIGKATLRLSGDYFVIATLAIGECTKLLIENMPTITGGSRGLTDIEKGTSFPLVLVLLVVIVVGLANFCILSKEETAWRYGKKSLRQNPLGSTPRIIKCWHFLSAVPSAVWLVACWRDIWGIYIPQCSQWLSQMN